MITSLAYAKRLRRKAIMLMRGVWAQAEIICTNPGRRAVDSHIRAFICVNMASEAKIIFARLSRSGF